MAVVDEFFPPQRHVKQLMDGHFLVTVTPPEFMGCQATAVVLNGEQFKKYLHWRDTEKSHRTIQEYLPELNPDEQEILISGIGPDDWDRLMAEMGEQS